MNLSDEQDSLTEGHELHWSGSAEQNTWHQELVGFQGVYSGSASSVVPWIRRCTPGDYLQVLL